MSIFGKMSSAGITINPIGAPVRAIKATGSQAAESFGNLRDLGKSIIDERKRTMTAGEPITNEYIEIGHRVAPAAMKQLAAEHRQAAVWLLACSLGAFASIAVSLLFGYLICLPAVFPAMALYMMSARRAWLSYIIVTGNADCRFNSFLVRYGWGKFAIFGE